MSLLPKTDYPLEEPCLSDARLKLIVGLVAATLFMEILDGTVITTALPSMARDFGRSAIELNIGISAYLLALGIFIPASGWVAERYGIRRIFIAAIALFVLTSGLCGQADHLPFFVVTRIFQGVAGAMMVPVGRLAVLKYAPKHRMMWAMTSLVWPALIAPVLGPPLGGFLTTHLTWRWIFYLNIPLGAVALIATVFIVPDYRAPNHRRFDWLGFVLCGGGSIALLSGFERMVGAIDATGLLSFCTGIVLSALSILHFKRSAAPMLDLSHVRIPTFRASLLGGSLQRIAIGTVPLLLPLMFQVGFGYDAFHSGLLLLAVFVGNFVMKSVTTPILKRFGYRRVLIWNGFLSGVALILCACIWPHMPLPITIIILIFAGLTRSMQFTALGTLAYADVPRSGMADANGLFNTVSQLAMGAGITLGASCVRFGHLVSTRWEITSPGVDYRIAFWCSAIIAFVGLVDFIALEKDAGDHFVKG